MNPEPITYDTCRELLKEKIYAYEGRRVVFNLDRERDPIIKGLVKHQHFAYHHFVENLFTKALMDALRDKYEDVKLRKGLDIKIELEPFLYHKLGRYAYVRYASKDINDPRYAGADEKPIDGEGKTILPRRARIKKLSYNTGARVRFKVRLERPPGSGRYYVRPDDFDEKPRKTRTKIGEIPVMVGSGFCSLYRDTSDRILDPVLYSDRRDPGGYIIHEGTDRAIIMKETGAQRIFIIARPKEDHKRANAVSSRTAAYNQVRKTYVEMERGFARRVYVTRPKFSASGELSQEERKSVEVPAYAVFEALYALIKSEEEGKPPEEIEIPEEEVNAFITTSVSPIGDFRKIEEFDRQLQIRRAQAEEFREMIKKLSYERAENKLKADYERKIRKTPPTKKDIEKKAEEIFLQNKRRFINEYVARVFLQDFFMDYDRDDPTRNIYRAKALVLGSVIRRLLLRIEGRVPYDDRDHYRFKRVVSSGDLLAMIVSEGIKDYVKTMYDNLVDAITDITTERKISGAPEDEKSIKEYLNRIGRAIAKIVVEHTGDKSSAFNEKISNILGTGKLLDITGVTEVMERTNHYYLLALLRRIKVLMEKKRKNPEVRDLHPTQRGRMCPDETPDGLNIGIQKHMAIGAMFTQGLLKHEREMLVAILRAIKCTSIEGKVENCLKGLEEANNIEFRRDVFQATGKPPAQVILDGEVIGVVTNPEEFVEEFRRIRRLGLSYVESKYPELIRTERSKRTNAEVRKGKLVDILKRYDKFIPNRIREIEIFFSRAIKEVNIHYEPNENIVRISADGGRMRRPLIVLFKNRGELDKRLKEEFYAKYKNEIKNEIESLVKKGHKEEAEELERTLERMDPRKSEDEPFEVRYLKHFVLHGILTEEELERAFVNINGAYMPSDELFRKVIEFARSINKNARDMLLEFGLIEYLDAQEEEYALVALRPKDVTIDHTHVEIHPARIFGVSASLLPFQEHNHSPRNIYGAGMAKQAIGLPYADFPIRVMSSTRILFYPQVPLVTTKGGELSGYHERPYGENMIVAVQVMEGYNMRDAIVLNQSSVERGLARDYLLKRVEILLVGGPKSPEGIISNTQVGVVIPREADKLVDNQIYKIGVKKSPRVPHYFRKLGEDGVVEPEVLVKRGEVLVGRAQPSRFETKRMTDFVDTSETMKEHFPMYVNDVLFFIRAASDLYTYVRLRDHRPPSLGDKFATRQGQKGVVGMLYRQEDLPYTADGIVPDLILNPHAMPSRMTLGLIIEGLASLIALKTGKPFDGTPFRFKDPRIIEEYKKKRFPNRDIEDISAMDIVQRRLKELGFNPYGERTMYDGRTGRMLNRKIFLVSLHYRRLKHEVRDKMHMRSRGKYQLHIRQPTEGKSREGGLRVGEMERDTFVGHGASFVLLDRMLVNSDETTIYVCKNCGGIGYYKREGGREVPVCPFCGKPDLYPVKVPYPFYVLYVTLLAMGIMPKIKLHSRFD